MYKLLCSNITKSHRSLTNFTGYYRKVAQKCNRGASSSKKFLSETDLQNKQGVEEGADSVECSEEALETDIKSDKKTKSYSSFFTQNISITPLSRPEVSAEQLIATTAAPSRFFHSSTVDNKCSTAAFKKPFKNKEAEKYYQLAVEQCMEIRSKLDKLHQQSNFAIRPAGLTFKVQNEFEHIDTKNNKNKPKQKSLKKIHKEKLMKIPELEKIAEMKTAKPRSQFKQSKIRITYPTHIARYKVGTNGFKMQHTLKQQVVKDKQVKTVYRDPVPEPLQLKVKHETSTEKDKAEAQKLRNKTYQRRLQLQCNDDNSEHAKQQLKYNKSMMQQHPTVRRANSSVRMAFKNRYNKLLQKSGLLYQAPTKTKEEDKDQAENRDTKRPTSPKPAPSYRDAEEVLFRRIDMQEPQVTEHPIATAKQAKVESSLKYPKRILSEKSENYDIDATCIKNSNHSNVTTTYGDFIAESEEKVKHFVETHKQEAKGLEDHKDSKVSLKTIEKIPSSDGFGEYLRKLKELRDQTAVERLNIKKTEMPKQDMTKADSKKIKEVITKLEDQIDKTPKDESENAVEVKAEVKSDIVIDKDKGKMKQYPISDKFVVKKDEDSLIRKAVNAVRDTVIRRTRPKKPKVRSQSVEHLRQEKSSVTQSIPLKKVRSENLIKKVLSKSAKPKTDTPQPIIQSAPLKTNPNDNLPKKIKSKLPTPSSNKSQEKYKFTRPEVSKETSEDETNPLKKIMDQYRVPCKTEFKISTAELKRINRRKRREREKQLMEEVKLQHRKLDEEAREAMVKEKEAVRDHKYRLDSKISESKPKEDLAIADEELLQQKEEIALKELEKDFLNIQENPELFASKAQQEREAHDSKIYLEEDGQILKEKEVQEQVSCSTTEIKVVNNLQNPEQIVEKTAVLEENLENVSDKRINQQRKLLAEENLAKLKKYPEKNKDMIVEERGQRLETRVENKIIEKKAKLEQIVPKANYIDPKKYLEKASDKKQPLYKNNLEINKKAQDPTKIEFQYMKSQNKLKTKKAKVKTQVLGKRKNLLTPKEASEKLTSTTLKNKENHLLTNVEKPFIKKLKEIEPVCNKLTENAQKENFQKVTRKVTEQRQSSAEDNIEDLKIISKQVENALFAEQRMEVSQKDADKDNSITTQEKLEIHPDTSEEVKAKYILDTKSKSVKNIEKEPAEQNLENTSEKLSEENNIKDSSTELEKSSTPLKEKALQKLKEIAAKTGSEKIEEKENQQTKKSLENDSKTLREVKGKYLLEANLNKTDSSILRETVKENIKTANTGSEITRSTIEAAAKGNSEKREETEEHKLEKGSEKPTDIVRDVKEKYLLEANLKKVVNNILQEETLKENLDKMPEKSLAKCNLNELKVSKDVDSITSKEKDMHMLKREQEENLRESLEKHSNIAADIKGKYMLENCLKKFTDDVLEEQPLKENVPDPSSLEDNLVKSENIPKQNFRPALEVKDKEEQTLKKDAEKWDSTVSEEEKRETAEERAKINFSNVLEEIRKHIPHINIKNLLEEQMPKKEKNVSKSKDSPQQKEHIAQDREKMCKKTEAKDVQKLERDLEKYSPETKAKTTLNEQPSDKEKSLLDNSMQEEKAESSASLFVTRNKLEGKQPDAKSPIKENSMVNKINKFQQGNLMKLKEASTRLVKMVKNIDLMKPTQKVEEKIEKSTVPENRPTIRREQPPKPTDKNKKEKPKSKTDIVLPPKGRNDPKMQHTTRNATLDEPRRNFIEEINEALSKMTHSSLWREETKKCKSLADLAEEQKAKILKEIEVTWNKENDKTRHKNEASKDELELSSKEQEELGTANKNKIKNVREYYESIIDMQKRKLNVDNATFCPSVTKGRDAIKNNSTWSEEHPRLIVKLRYKGESKYEKPNDMPTNYRAEYAMGKSASCFTTPQKTSKDGTSTEPQIPNFTVFKGKSDKPQFDKDEGLSALHFRRTKKARIEDDFLKIEPRVLNVGYTTKEDSWHSQNDLDFNFTKLKKARIEDDHIMYEIKDIKESPEQTHNENDVEEAKADIVNGRWCSNGDTAFCFQKQQRRKIEDDTRVKEILSGKGEYDSIKKISSQSTILDQSGSIGKEEIVRKVEAKFEDLEDEINRSVKEEPLKNLSKTELSKNDTKTATEKSDIKHKVEASGPKIAVRQDPQIKTNIEKLIHVMKKADKELEEVLKVYEILKLPQTQYRTLVKPADYNNTKQDNVEMKEECLKFKGNIALLAGKQSKNNNKKQDKTETKETNLKLKENTELVATKKIENHNSIKHDKVESREKCLKLKESTELVKKAENYKGAKHDKVETTDRCLKLNEGTEMVAVKKTENCKDTNHDKAEKKERCLKLKGGTEEVAVKKTENYNNAKHDKAETKERCLQLKEGTEAVAVKKNENYNSAKHDKVETKERCLTLKEGTETVAVKKNENYNSAKHDKVETKERCLTLKEGTEAVAVKKNENYNSTKHDKVETKERCLTLKEGTEAVAVKKNENYNSAKHDKVETKERCLTLKEGTEAVAVKKNENYSSTKHDKVETKERCLTLKEGTEAVAVKKNENYNSAKHDKVETKERCLTLKEGTEAVAVKKNENYNTAKHDKAETKEKCLKLKENVELIAGKRVENYNSIKQNKAETKEKSLQLMDSTELVAGRKTENYSSTKQDKEKCLNLKDNTKLVAVRKAKPNAKDSETYMVAASGEKCSKKDNNMGFRNETKKKLSTPQSEKKVCKLDEKSTKTTVNPNKYLLTAGIQKQAKRQLRGRSEEAKGNNNKTTTGCVQRQPKRAKICHKDEKKADSTTKTGKQECNKKDILKEYKKSSGKKNLLCPPVKMKSAKLDCSKYEEKKESKEPALEKNGSPQNSGGTSKEYSDGKLIVQMLTNNGKETLGNKIVVTCNNCLPGESLNERDKTEERREKQEKPVEIPGKRKTKVRAQPMHVSMSSDIPHNTPTSKKDRKRRRFSNSMVEKPGTLPKKRVRTNKQNDITLKKVSTIKKENNVSAAEQQLIDRMENLQKRNMTKLDFKPRQCKKKAEFPILRSDLVDMFIKTKYDRKIKIIQTMFINRKVTNGATRDTKSFSTRRSQLAFNEENECLFRKFQKKKTFGLSKGTNITTTEHTSFAEQLCKSKLKIITLARNVRENIFQTKYMLDKQIEVLETIALPRLGTSTVTTDCTNTILEDKCDTVEEKEKEIVNRDLSGEVPYSKGEKVVTLLEKKLMDVSKALLQGKSAHDLENKESKGFSGQTENMEESNGYTSKGNLKSDSGDCKKGYSDQNQIKHVKFESSLMKLEGKEQQQGSEERVVNHTEEKLFTFSNNYLDYAYKKVRHILSIVNDENIYLAEENSGVNKEIQNLGKENRDGKLPEEKSESKSLVELKQDEILERNKEGNKLLGIGYCEYQNTKIDSKKLESEIEKCCLNWKYNTMETNINHNLEQKLHTKKLGKVSQDIGQLQHENEVSAKEGGDENVQTKTELTENQNTEKNEVEKKSEQNFTDKKLLKTQNSTTEVGIKPNSMLIALENKSTNVTSSMKNPGSNQLQSFASLCNLEENSSKSNRLTSITEPCLKYFRFNISHDIKPEEKSKYKYTSQRIRQHLIRKNNYIEMNKTKESEKRPWQGEDRSLYKKTGIEVIGNRYKPQQKNEYTYTSQKIKQSLMRKEENNIEMNKMNVNKKRIRDIHDESVSRTSSHLKKRQKTVPKITEKRYVIQDYSGLGARRKKIFANEISHKTGSKLEVTEEKNKVEKQEQESKVNEDRNENKSQISGICSGFVAPKNSDSNLKLTYEKLKAEEKLKKMFIYYLSHLNNCKSKFPKNENNNSAIPPSKTRKLVSTPRKGNNIRKRSILSQIKKNALPTVLEVSPENTDMKCQSEMQTASENCKQKRDLDEESSNNGSKELLPQGFVRSRKDIQKTVMGSLKFSEKLMRKLSPNKMDYDPRKGPMKARIEQIFKKHYKEEEMIYRFNKNLIRHLQQPCEKTPLVFQKQPQIVFNRALLDPSVTEINEMQKMLYKFLATEMKKPISESPVGFSLFKKCNKWEGIVYYSKDKQKSLTNDPSEKEPKAVPKRSVTFFIEKAPRNRYKKENSEVPLKPITRSCERLCLPLKAISQVALKPSVEEMTTLNKYHIGKVNAISTIIPNVLDKYKGLKITYINIKRPMKKSEEGFLPTILTMRDKNELKALEKVNDPETIKRQILEFRYELLRKLHREFSALYEKDVNKNIGKFEMVSKYYKSVKPNLKNKVKDEVVTKLQSKSMEELLGPSSKPSFERVSRYYNIIMDKNKDRDGEGTSQEVWNNAKTLVQKLSEETTEIDKSRNDCKGVEQILTKSKKKENNDEKDPEDPKKQS